MGEEKTKRNKIDLLIILLTIIALILSSTDSVIDIMNPKNDIEINKSSASKVMLPDTGAYCQILIDRSENMAIPFDGLTKWEAAKMAINTYLAHFDQKYDKTSLRYFGGICPDQKNSLNMCDNLTKLVVEFGENNQKAIIDSLEKMDLNGVTTLFCGLIKSIHDFLPFKKISPEKHVIVITSGIDICDFGAMDLLLSRLDAQEIKPTIKLIGLAVPKKERKMLYAFANSINALYDTVENIHQLKRSICGLPILEVLPDSIKQIIYSSNQISNKLIMLTSLNNSKNYNEAKPIIGSAQNELVKFKNLLQRYRTNKPNFLINFYNLVDSLFQIQKSMFKIAASRQQLHDKDIEKVVWLTERWNKDMIPNYRRISLKITIYLNKYYILIF